MGVRNSVQEHRQRSQQCQFHRDLYSDSRQRAQPVSLSTAANQNLVVWMVSPTRGLFLVIDPNTVQDGRTSTCSRFPHFRIQR